MLIDTWVDKVDVNFDKETDYNLTLKRSIVY